MQQRPRRNPFRTSLGPLYLLDACCFLSSFAIWKIDDFIKMCRKTPSLQGWGYKARPPNLRK